MPERIQLRRTKGYRKPEGAVVVTRASKWGNPYRISGPYVVEPTGFEHYCAPGEQHGVAVRLFREALLSGHLPFDWYDVFSELRGRDLACYCPLDKPCHADVLLDIAENGFGLSPVVGIPGDGSTSREGTP